MKIRSFTAFCVLSTAIIVAGCGTGSETGTTGSGGSDAGNTGSGGAGSGGAQSGTGGSASGGSASGGSASGGSASGGSASGGSASGGSASGGSASGGSASGGSGSGGSASGGSGSGGRSASGGSASGGSASGGSASGGSASGGSASGGSASGGSTAGGRGGNTASGGRGGSPGSGGGGGASAGFSSIAQLLGTNCATSMCHDAASGHVDLRNDAGLRARLVGVKPAGSKAKAECKSLILVNPGAPATSIVSQMTKASLSACGAKMPDKCSTTSTNPRACLTAAQIAQINAWITAGAPN